MWEYLGITGGGDTPPPVFNNFKGSILIIGPARNVWDDLKNIEEYDVQQVMTVNMMTALYPFPVDHHVSLDKNVARTVRTCRERFIDENFFYSHTQEYEDGSIPWYIDHQGGTTGLFAVLVAVCLGFRKIILAGVPLSNEGYFYYPPDFKVRNWCKYDERSIRIAWVEQIQKGSWSNMVRSCSGRTASFFGKPDLSWFRS